MPRAPRTATALLVGLALTAVLSATLTIAGLKAGILPGVSPLVVLFAWGAFARRLASPGGSRFLNITQVAGSAGMAVAAGVVFTAPLLPILQTSDGSPSLTEYAALRAAVDEPELPAGEREARLEALGAMREQLLERAPGVDVATMILLSLAGAAIGFGFTGLATRKFLTDRSLPAPEATACRTMIDAAVAHPESRPKLGRSLLLGVLLGALAPLAALAGYLRSAIVLLPFGANELGRRAFTNTDGSRSFAVDVHMAPIYIGIGGLLTLATALLVFAGSAIHATGGVLLAGIDSGTELAERFPANSMRWVGGAAMTVAVAWSLVRFAGSKTERGELGHDEDDPRLLAIPGPVRGILVGSIALGAGVVVGWLLLNDGATPFALAISTALLATAAVMVTLGALLSLQVGSSASPVSGTIFVTTLTLCLVALALHRREVADVALLTPLLVGACVAVCTANDSSQDYKTLQLCGLPVREGFVAQALGLAVGAVVVPIVLTVSHQAYVLGSPDLAAPQGALFATLTEALLLESELPWAPIGVGLVLGLVAVGIEVFGMRRRLLLPSMALAVGIYLPPYLGFGMLIGAVARFAAERRGNRRAEGILVSAGLITGAALLDLVLGFAILGGVRAEEALAREQPLDPLTLDVSSWAALLVLAGVIWVNSRPKKKEVSAS